MEAAILVIGWIVLSFAVCAVAKKKNRSGVAWFFISIFLSPIIAIIILSCVGDANKQVMIKKEESVISTSPKPNPNIRRAPKHPKPYDNTDIPDAECMRHLDPMFGDVARFVVSKQEGSTSRIQRAFEIGYNRAGKLSDQLEVCGILGPNKGTQGREVLISDLSQLEELLGQLEMCKSQGELPSMRKVHANDYLAEQFIHFRNNITSQKYDIMLEEVILWTVDEELIYLKDLEEEFAIEYGRAKELTRQLIELGIWSEGGYDEEHEVLLDDIEVARMICEYIKKHCELEEMNWDITEEFENIKRQINYDNLKELDPLFEDVADWIIDKDEFSIATIQKRFNWSTVRAVEVIDQLFYSRIIGREDENGKTIHFTIIHNPLLVSKICQHVRDYVSGYLDEEPVQEPEPVQVHTETCFVYLMHDTSNDFYKIGISKDPQYRERTLQSEKPTIEKICAKEFPTRQIAEALESALHKSFATKRIRGEWFSLTPDDIANVKATLA